MPRWHTLRSNMLRPLLVALSLAILAPSAQAGEDLGTFRQLDPLTLLPRPKIPKPPHPTTSTHPQKQKHHQKLISPPLTLK